MLMTLREAIYERVKGMEANQLLDVMEGSIGGDEKALPGLGVLFEIIWENLDKEDQERMAEILSKHLPTVDAN